ncbi:MAG TPA: CPBP family intramembrane glutamic endopeptidase [Rhodanobacteraceae bacterium]
MIEASPKRDVLFRVRQLCWIAFSAALFVLIESDFIVFLIALVAIAIVAFETRAPLRALGLGRPRSIVRVLALGIALGVAMLFFSKLLLTPIAEAITGIPRDLSAFEDVRGNVPFYLKLMPRIWLGAAVCEEIIFRAFLIGRLEAAFGGPSRLATAAAVTLASALFGFAHAYQGPTGILITGTLGLIFACVYAYGGRNLWLNIVVHGVYDTLSLGLVLTSYDRVFAEIARRLVPH